MQDIAKVRVGGGGGLGDTDRPQATTLRQRCKAAQGALRAARPSLGPTPRLRVPQSLSAGRPPPPPRRRPKAKCPRRGGLCVLSLAADRAAKIDSRLLPTRGLRVGLPEALSDTPGGDGGAHCGQACLSHPYPPFPGLGLCSAASVLGLFVSAPDPLLPNRALGSRNWRFLTQRGNLSELENCQKPEGFGHIPGQILPRKKISEVFPERKSPPRQKL